MVTVTLDLDAGLEIIVALALRTKPERVQEIVRSLFVVLFHVYLIYVYCRVNDDSLSLL